MVSVNEVYSKYLSHDLVKELNMFERPLTIQDAEIVEFEEKGIIKKKIVVEFGEVEQKLVLNVTNAGTISRLLGDDTDDWLGKHIYLVPTVRTAFGKPKPALAVLGELPTDEKRIKELDNQMKVKE